MSSTIRSSSSIASIDSYSSMSCLLPMLATLLLRLRSKSGRSQKELEVGVQQMGVVVPRRCELVAAAMGWLKRVWRSCAWSGDGVSAQETREQ